MKQVVYRGYLQDILVPHVGVFTRDVPQEVSNDIAEALVKLDDFEEVQEVKKTKVKGGDES